MLSTYLPPNRQSKIYTFCKQNKIFARFAENPELARNNATHYMMNGIGGGILMVPDSLHFKFLEMYAEDLVSGEIHYLIERRTKIFRWLADLDFVGPRELSKEEIVLCVKKIQEILQRFYPTGIREFCKNLFDAVILTTEPGKKPDGSIKTGIHLVMPNLSVTQKECLDMRMTILAELEIMKFFPEEEKGSWNAWEDIVDACVYSNNGLRMPGSYKLINCDHCRRDRIKKLSCEKCEHTGFLNAGRVYGPTIYVQQNGTISEERVKHIVSSKYQMIELLSIRQPTPKRKYKWRLPLTAPSAPLLTSTDDATSVNQMLYLDESIEKKFAGNKRKRDHPNPSDVHSVSYREDQQKMRGWKDKIAIDKNSRQFLDMQTFLQEEVNKSLYEKIQIKDMFNFPTKGFYYITTKGYGSQNCMNMIDNGKHNNNTIFFTVTTRGVSQKCFCKCTGPDKLKFRKKGACKDFKSKPVSLSDDLFELLFEKKNTKSFANHLSHSQNFMMNFTGDEIENNPKKISAMLKEILKEKNEKMYKDKSSISSSSSSFTSSSSSSLQRFEEDLRRHDDDGVKDDEEIPSKKRKFGERENVCSKCEREILDLHLELEEKMQKMQLSAPNEDITSFLFKSMEEHLRSNTFLCHECC